MREWMSLLEGRGGGELQDQVTDRFAYSDKWRITNLDLQIWSVGEKKVIAEGGQLSMWLLWVFTHQTRLKQP